MGKDVPPLHLPEHAHDRPAESAPWAIVGFLLILGLLAIVAGVVDVLTAVGSPARVIGLIFAVGGGVMCAGGGALFRRETAHTWGRLVALIGTTFAIAASMYLLTLQIAYPSFGKLLGWSTALLVAIGAFIALVRLPHESRRTTASERGIIGTLTSVGVTVTFLFSILQFAYASSAPGQVGAEITPSVEFGATTKLPNGDRLLTADVKLKNGSATKVQTVGSLYRLVGENLTAGKDEPSALETTRYNEGRDVERGYTDRSKLIAYGPLLEEGTYFEPGEEWSTSLTFPVPEAKHFDSARLELTIVVARGVRLSVNPIKETTDLVARPHRPILGHQYVVREFMADRVSVVRQITAGNDFVRVVHVLPQLAASKSRPIGVGSVPVIGPQHAPVPRVDQPADDEIDPTPYLISCIDERYLYRGEDDDGPSICPERESIDHKRLRTFYGLAYNDAHFDVTLSSPSQP
jgi:hypothetical protein